MESEQIYKNLGNRIRNLRKNLHQTQEQLAKQIGISRASLANIESGRQQVLVHHLFSLAYALQLESPEQLLLPLGTQSRRKSAVSPLPFSDKELTDQQRREILSLMDTVLVSNSNTTVSEET